MRVQIGCEAAEGHRGRCLDPRHLDGEPASRSVGCRHGASAPIPQCSQDTTPATDCASPEQRKKKAELRSWG